MGVPDPTMLRVGVSHRLSRFRSVETRAPKDQVWAGRPRHSWQATCDAIRPPAALLGSGCAIITSTDVAPVGIRSIAE